VVALAVIEADGGMHAVGAPPSAEAARRAIERLFSAADEASAGLNESGLEQVVVDTRDGAVAALRNGGRCAVAVTRPHPSSLGLLLYDLRRALSIPSSESPGAGS
jgi:predicted regulator of Ras-like GTPase activity (Roadblock/LC7/MglB family)